MSKNLEGHLVPFLNQALNLSQQHKTVLQMLHSAQTSQHLQVSILPFEPMEDKTKEMFLLCNIHLHLNCF